MNDSFDVNSPEAQLMRLHEALDDLGRRMQGVLDAVPLEDPVKPSMGMWLSSLARCTGEVQGMASILDTLGYAADR